MSKLDAIHIQNLKDKYMAHSISLQDLKANYFTVEEIVAIPCIDLRRSRISFLFKEYGVKKIGNKYYASKKQVVEILQRENTTVKRYNINGSSLEEILEKAKLEEA